MKFVFFVSLFYYSTAFTESIDTNVSSLNIWERRYDIYNIDNEMLNCTMYVIKATSSCICFQCTVDKRTVCCTPSMKNCCYNHKCDACWEAEMRLITVTHISVFILFLLGTAAIIALFFKIRYRIVHVEQPRFPVIRSECNNNLNTNTSQCCVLHNLRDRPPPYVEACGAPPLYGSPSNMVSMTEAPPAYPGSVQTSVAHHM